jgi:LuxR family maltose regulon positive regulatory protein
MGTSLLATKLHVPSVRSELVPRPRLTGRLDEGLERKLTLVSAPAGFGKTTLVSEWVTSCETPVAWVSLDEGDNDLTRFLSYLIAALQTIQADLGAGALDLLQSPQPPLVEPILTALINEVVAGSRGPSTSSAGPGQDSGCGFVLVLDDYHIIESLPVDKALAFLLDHLPSNMHVLLTSRTDPSLPLSRLRARAQITEVRVDDLRFTPDEVAAFLNRTMGLNLSAENVAALEARTEGWIAGLQLTALSMQGLGQGDSITSFVNGFTGSNRYILDYLTDEVLQQRPAGTEDFLLQTSILERLSGPLCDAVRFDPAETPSSSTEHAVRFGGAKSPNRSAAAGQNGSQGILESLEAANLFLVPLDANRVWYRYHHLFADLLRQRLHRFRPEQVPILHRRASHWFEGHGLLEESLKHALAARDFECAAGLVEQLAQALWERGEPTSLLRWLDVLPDEQISARPGLCSYSAWALYVNGQNQAAERLLQVAEEALNTDAAGRTRSLPGGLEQLSEPDIREELGRVAAIRASLAFRQGDVSGIFGFSRQALDLLSEKSLMWRSITAMALGMAQDLSGDTVAASRTLSEAVATSKACDNIYLILSTSLHLGTILMTQGRLKQAYGLCQELLKLAEERSILHTEMAGCLFDELGLVLCEWNDLDEAGRHLERGAELSRQGYDVGVLGYSYLTTLRYLFAQQDVAGAEKIINEMDQMGHGSDVPPWYTSPKEAWRARFWLAQGDLNAAAQWANDRELNADGEVPYLREEEYIALARILVAQGRFEKARELLARLLKEAENGGQIARVTEILMIQALACQTQGEDDKALDPLARALSLAEPGGYVRAFVDEGAPMASLLRQMISRGVTERTSVTLGYVNRLLAAFEPKQARQLAPSEQPLVVPISERELEVLRLIAAGLSNQEIAQELIIALGTVKAHTSAIYRKLDARGRAQAVIRASELELL